MDTEPRLVSFVVRFVYEDAPESGAFTPEAPGWHGIIRHVQSNAERHFTRWADAQGFIEEYVALGHHDR